MSYFYSFGNQTNYEIPTNIMDYIKNKYNNDYHEIGLMNLLYEIIKNNNISTFITQNIDANKFSCIYQSLQEFIQHKQNDKIIPYTNLHLYIEGLDHIPTNEVIHLYIHIPFLSH
jgi:hypothetical protein